MWQDTNKIGPERAFEHCWNQFPDSDIIIIHSDMAPMPEDKTNGWYDALLEYRKALPQAGMIGCNLFFPRSGTGDKPGSVCRRYFSQPENRSFTRTCVRGCDRDRWSVNTSSTSEEANGRLGNIRRRPDPTGSDTGVRSLRWSLSVGLRDGCRLLLRSKASRASTVPSSCSPTAR
jgi:hypothetical protein